MSGFSGLFGKNPIHPIPIAPFLDRPARLTELHNSTAVRGGSLIALIVDFGEKRVAVTSSRLSPGPAHQQTLRDFLATRRKPQNYDLFQVENKKGDQLGYLLMNGERVDNYFLFDEQTVFIAPVEVLTP
jgi:hypothetical protein